MLSAIDTRELVDRYNNFIPSPLGSSKYNVTYMTYETISKKGKNNNIHTLPLHNPKEVKVKCPDIVYKKSRNRKSLKYDE